MPEDTPGPVEKAAQRRTATPATTDQPAKQTARAYVGEVIARQAGRLAAVSPSGFDTERFANLVITAVRATPQLLDCFESPAGEMSVLLAAMQAAEVGLEPNTPLQHCWLLPRRNAGNVECQLSIGYRGYIDLAGRSDRVKTIFAEVVHTGDEFHWARGLDADEFVHRPGPDPRGDLTHAYAVVRYTNGGYNFVVLDRAAVEKRRGQSDSYKSERGRAYSPWVTNTESMWKKSAVRALVPYLPLAAAAAAVISRDDTSLAVDDDDQIIATYQADPDRDAIDTTGSDPT